MDGDITYASCSSFILQLAPPLNPHRPENSPSKSNLSGGHLLAGDTLASHLTFFE